MNNAESCERKPKYINLDDAVESLVIITRQFNAFLNELDTGPSPVAVLGRKDPEPPRAACFQGIYDDAAQRIQDSINRLVTMLSDLRSRLF